MDCTDVGRRSSAPRHRPWDVRQDSLPFRGREGDVPSIVSALLFQARYYCAPNYQFRQSSLGRRSAIAELPRSVKSPVPSDRRERSGQRMSRRYGTFVHRDRAAVPGCGLSFPVESHSAAYSFRHWAQRTLHFPELLLPPVHWGRGYMPSHHLRTVTMRSDRCGSDRIRYVSRLP